VTDEELITYAQENEYLPTGLRLVDGKLEVFL